MKIKELRLKNFRGLKNTTISLNPGFNLIVGVNGAGKSSILDAIRISMNQVWPKLFGKASPKSNLGYEIGDIQVDESFLNSQLFFSIHGEENYEYDVIKQRKPFISHTGGKSVYNGDSIYKSQSGSKIIEKSELKLSNGQVVENIHSTREEFPLFLYFSVDRSRITTKTTQVYKGVETAWLESFHSNRGLNIQEIASWWVTREILVKEKPSSLNGKHLRLLKSVLAELLPECNDWTFHQDDDNEKKGNYDLILKKKVKVQRINAKKSTIFFKEEEQQLHISQLSEGERCIASIVFDIARRLILLNPKDNDPIKNGHGIVLIDEIDLHLHPKWQRKIVNQLKTIFPKIQFICTSHSPFLIQSVFEGELIKLDGEITAEYSNQSIEDIAEYIQSIEMPQKSRRYLDMMKAAEKYFTLLRQENKTEKQIGELKRSLDNLEAPFSDDPAYQALLKLERISFLGDAD